MSYRPTACPSSLPGGEIIHYAAGIRNKFMKYKDETKKLVEEYLDTMQESAAAIADLLGDTEFTITSAATTLTVGGMIVYGDVPARWIEAD